MNGSNKIIAVGNWRLCNDHEDATLSGGLYSNSGVNWVQRIQKYGMDAGLYYLVIGYGSSVTFSPEWWHFIYKIPRRW